MRQDFSVYHSQRIRLVFLSTRRKQIRSGIGFHDTRVVTGGKVLGAIVFRELQQFAELNETIAEYTGVGCAPLPVLAAKVINNLLKVLTHV